MTNEKLVVQINELQQKLETIESTLEDVRQRLQITEDIREIEQLHYRYVNNLSFAQYDQLVELFAEDSTIDFPPIVKGKESITKHYKEGIATRHVGKEHDLLVHPLVTMVETDKARGYWLLYMKSETFPDWLQRVMETEYIRENGAWKFSYIYSRARLGWPAHLPPDGGLPDTWNGTNFG